MVDLDLSTKNWRYYTKKESLEQLQEDMQPGSFYADNMNMFISPYTGQQVTRPRIWIIPFSDLDSSTWPSRTFTNAQNGNGFSGIDFFNGSSYININNLEFYFGSAGNPVHIQYGNYSYVHITFDNVTWWGNGNTPPAWFMAYRNGWDINQIEPTNLSHWTIRNSDFRYGGSAGIFYITWAIGNVDHIIIENNYFAYVGSNPDATGQPEDWIGGIGGDNHVIGLQKGDDITIQNNTIYKAGGTAIESWAASGIAGVSQNRLRIIGNKFIKCGHKYAGHDSKTSGRSVAFSGDQHLDPAMQLDNLVAYNLFYDSEAMIGIGQRADIKVLNNTGIKVGEGIRVGNNYFPINAKFKNNSVIDVNPDQVGISFGGALTSPSLIYYAFQSPSESGDTFVFSNNHAWDPEKSGRYSFIKGNEVNTSADIKQFVEKINSFSGMSASKNFEDDPHYIVNFIEPSGKFDKADLDFSILAPSPLIDAGLDVGLSYDYTGGFVPRGLAPDIGAYEKNIKIGDLNLDDLVNLVDFNFLKVDFLKFLADFVNRYSDIDGDERATIKDVGIMMSEWEEVK